LPTALITGITGQDGSYLAELLLERGYAVVGTTRAAAGPLPERIAHLAGRVRLVRADLLDRRSLDEAVRASRPDEVYNLASQSSVAGSWDGPVETGDQTAIGVTRLLEAVRTHAPAARVCQAGSSEIFGAGVGAPMDETTPVRPRNPYGAAKAYAHFMTAGYRESGRLHAVSAILFNHESPRRGVEYVTRKITRAAAAISLGREREVRLGNLEVRRDWGFAGDYVDAMWRTLQAGEPQDYVVGTGEPHSVREFCAAAFSTVGLDYREHVVRDERFVRPGEPDLVVADPRKARERLGWAPAMTFERLVETMVDADLRRLRDAR
jgi:GDPmannose 4,6-dehydratase